MAGQVVIAPDLGSGALRRGGSSPFSRTKLNPVNLAGFFSLKMVV